MFVGRKIHASQMNAPGTQHTQRQKEPRKQTPTFLLELPLVVTQGQAKRLQGHLEAGRQLYNAVLSEGQQRLRQMRADPAWAAARAIPRSHKHEIVAVGNTILLEKISYQAWQKLFGKSVGLRAPGMFVALLRRTVVSTGGTLTEIPTRTTKLSQYCHGCGNTEKKSLSQRWHTCPCGVGPVQRDLYSAFLAAYLDPADPIPSCAQYVVPWEGAEVRLQAAHERVQQRANEGQILPRSFGCARAGARRPESRNEPTLELAFSLRRGRLEAWTER
jgi:hypothetical protein